MSPTAYVSLSKVPFKLPFLDNDSKWLILSTILCSCCKVLPCVVQQKEKAQLGAHAVHLLEDIVCEVLYCANKKYQCYTSESDKI